jgi:EmrB/QacA subfamily drug resistance transporter
MTSADSYFANRPGRHDPSLLPEAECMSRAKEENPLATPSRPTRADQSGYPADVRSSWDRRKWYILAAICVAQFIVVLDIAIVNVALPSIRTDLSFTNESLQWVLTAYAIMFGGFLLLGGRLADRFGRRRVFMAGLAIFTAASLMCGLAWSEGSLIAFRAVQGLGGALLSPAALSILATTFTEGRERNLALGIWGGIAGSGAAAGALLGGVLTSAFGWQWIFFVNVPIGAVLVGLTPLLLSREPAGALARRSFDVAGAVTVTGGLMVLVYALTRATQIGWATTETITLLVVSAALLARFAMVEARAADPILPKRVLRLPVPRTANIVGLLVGAALFSQFFLLTLYMQQVLQYSALRTGVAYAATTVTLVAVAIVAQALVTRIGPRAVLVTGLLLVSASIFLYSRLPVAGSYVSDLLPAFLLSGVGLGLTFVPIQISSLTGVRAGEAGAASGMINTSQQIGGAVGLAAITTIATTVTTSYIASHAASPLTAATGLVNGFQVAFYVLLGITLLGVVLSATLLRGTRVAAGGVVEEPVQGAVERFPTMGDRGDEGAAGEERPAA